MKYSWNAQSSKTTCIPHGWCVKTQLKHNIKYEAEIMEENIENIKFTNILKAASGVKIMHLQNSFTDTEADRTHYNKQTLK